MARSSRIHFVRIHFAVTSVVVGAEMSKGTRRRWSKREGRAAGGDVGVLARGDRDEADRLVRRQVAVGW